MAAGFKKQILSSKILLVSSKRLSRMDSENKEYDPIQKYAPGWQAEFLSESPRWEPVFLKSDHSIAIAVICGGICPAICYLNGWLDAFYMVGAVFGFVGAMVLIRVVEFLASWIVYFIRCFISREAKNMRRRFPRPPVRARTESQSRETT